MLMPKKKTIITIISISILILALALFQVIPTSLHTHKNLDTKQELIQHSLMKMLYPYIRQSITDYYGESKQFMNGEILDISMYGPYDIKIKLQVTTFEGPHNPPFGTEVITCFWQVKNVAFRKFKYVAPLFPDLTVNRRVG